MRSSTSFPIENTVLTLILYDDSRQSLEITAVRKLFFDAYTSVSNLIEIAGDGDIPIKAQPYKAATAGADLSVDARMTGPIRLKWSDLRGTLWGLREFMVVRRHLFEVVFAITRDEDGVRSHLGFGRVYRHAMSVYEIEG